MPEDRYAYFQRKSDERAQARADAAQSLRAAATPVAPEAIPTRPFGFQSGAARGAAEGRSADLAAAGVELGAPTSFNAGAGAPPPVEVVRGTRTTFTNPAPDTGDGGYNPTPGTGTKEYASPLQAAQAFNRGQLQAGGSPEMYGDYEPMEGPRMALQHQQRLEEIGAQGKSQEASMAGDLMTRKRNSEAFMNRIQSDPRFYKETPEGFQPVTPGLGQLLLGFKNLGEADPDKAYQAFEEKALRHIDESKHINDQGVTMAVTNLTKAGFTLTPGQKAWLATPQADPEAEKKRRDTILQWVKPATIPGPGQPGTVAPSQPSALRRGIDMQSLQGNVGGGDAGQPKPFSPSSSFLRPDQIGQMAAQFQRKVAEKDNLAALSKNTEERLRAAAY